LQYCNWLNFNIWVSEVCYIPDESGLGIAHGLLCDFYALPHVIGLFSPSEVD